MIDVIEKLMSSSKGHEMHVALTHNLTEFYSFHNILTCEKDCYYYHQ